MAASSKPTSDQELALRTVGSGARAVASGAQPAMVLTDPTHAARFELRGRLGEGAAGVVYDVVDHDRGARVALKVLTNADPEMLVSFKREFRALAGIVHKNLVQLYELLADGLTWFFTMELVEGGDFNAWVRPRAENGQLAKLDRDRLTLVVLQLVDGLAALHGAGKVHRDLKPSNVLVDRQGRVVLVDFGLAVDRAEAADEEVGGIGVLGTPAYMSPEQACGERVGPPGDVYSLGVMLFEVLTGRLPFSSRGVDALTEKLLRDAPRAREMDANVPVDLEELCAAMLSREPDERPTLDAVREALGMDVGAPSSRRASGRPSSRPSGRSAAALVGREPALGALRQALSRADEAVPQAVLVKGTSGYGKTALVRTFLEEARSEGNALVLEARCYERETIPHKTLDGVLDALARCLERDPELAEAVVPHGAWALARMFPQVGRLPAASGAPVDGAGRGPHEIRELAGAALAEILVGIGKRKPLLLFIDDLQWGDADGTALLRDVLDRIPSGRILLVLAFRGESVKETPWLSALVDSGRGLAAKMNVTNITIGPLTAAESAEVVRATVSPELAARPGLLDRIVEEAQGNPFFLGELVRHARTCGDALGDLRLASVVRARVDGLPGDVGALIEAIAVAGRPLSPQVAFRVTRLAPEKGMRAVAALQSATLLRSASAGHGGALECVHDRVRESVVESLGPESLRGLHARLADELGREPNADPENLAVHYDAAGDGARAREHYLLAARRAVDAVALDRAAALYREVLGRLPAGDPRERGLRLELGDVLANAARGAEAAVEYLSVANGAAGDERRALQRRAAEEWLFAGHVDQGSHVIAQVMAECGVTLRMERWRVLLMLVVLRLWLRLRGYEFVARDPQKEPPMAIARVDALIVAATGLSTIDNIVAAAYSVWSVLASMHVGDPWRVCRMLCLELQIESTEGKKAARRVQKMQEVADEIAAKLQRPDTSALVRAARANSLLFNGEWRRAAEEFAMSLEIYEGIVAAGARATEGQNFTARWETDTFRYFLLGALFQLGRWREMTDRYETYARDAQRRGDLYLWTNLQTGDSNYCLLFRDDPTLARRSATEALAGWSKGTRFQMQHWYAFQSLTSVDLYEGEGDAALARVRSTWGPLRSSFLLRIQYTRTRAWHLRARAEVLAGAARRASPGRLPRPADASLIAAAAVSAAKIRAEDVPWAQPLAGLVEAAVHRQRGELPQAIAVLARVQTEFENLEMTLWAAAARDRRGALTGGAPGETLRAEAGAAFAAEDVKDPDRMIRMMAPGLDP